MNVTTKGRYALRFMLDLAQHSGESYISLRAVADREGYSVKYLEAIAGNLKRSGLIESSRGKDGGYRLCRDPEKYLVGEILRSIEDNLAPVSCIKSGSVNCKYADVCLTIPMWKELDNMINAYLDTVTLRDLLTGSKWKKLDRS